MAGLNTLRWMLPLCVLFAGGATAAARNPRMALPAEPDGNRVQLAQRGDTRTLWITSPGGIGRVSLPEARRHRRVALRLRYAPAQPFKSLEGIEIDGRHIELPPKRRTAGWLRLTLPAELFAPGEVHRVQWVDAYRR